MELTIIYLLCLHTFLTSRWVPCRQKLSLPLCAQNILQSWTYGTINNRLVNGWMDEASRASRHYPGWDCWVESSVRKERWRLLIRRGPRAISVRGGGGREKAEHQRKWRPESIKSAHWGSWGWPEGIRAMKADVANGIRHAQLRQTPRLTPTASSPSSASAWQTA